MPVIAKQLGINATALGIGLSLIPVFTFLSNPMIGFLVDYFQNIKAFLIVLLITSATAYCAILSLPPINETNKATYVRISNSSNLEAVLNISQTFERDCLNTLLQKDIECKLRLEDKIEALYEDGNTTGDFGRFIQIAHNASEIQVLQDQNWVTFYITDLISDQIENISTTQVLQCSPPIKQCSLNKKINDPYSAYQFWAFFTLAVLGAVAGLSAHSLSSVACYELLGDQSQHYGRQRLYGTISWGLVSTLAGILNDLQAEKSFISGIYLLVVFIAIDLIILCVIHIPKAHMSASMGKDLCKIVSSKKILVFSLGVAVIGLLNAVIYVFEFWFLEDMGATRTLLGLSVFMQCLVGEVPFLFFAGWFVEKMGHFLCFALVFCAFFVRLVCYYLLKNPWLVLPVDILHGITFGVFHGAMASFANAKAPKGMEATLLGFFSGLYDGLGTHP